MKNIIKHGLFLLMAVFVMASCDPQEGDDYALGAAPQESQLSFSVTPKSGQPNIVDFKDESSVNGVALWNFGNGATAKGTNVSAQYPFAGTYNITMTLYTTGGSVSKSQSITVANDDMALLNTPMYNALTGGAANLAGKIWVFDQYHAGHFGIGPATGTTPEWWSCPAEGKEGASLYTQEFTFTQVGVKLNWKNNGKVYTNSSGVAALAGLGYPNSAATPVDDYDVEYAPKASYTFTLNETAKTLTLSDGAFFGHYAGVSSYQIVTLNENELYLRCVSALETGNAWYYRFIPKEKNIKPKEEVKEVSLEAIPLFEDFESETPGIVFGTEDIGSFFSQYYNNPLPLPINTSKRVCSYEKSTGFYSNIFFIADGYKFDLKEVNKVRVKVLIPSANDYTTENGVAGSWISNSKLKPQLAIKLQDNSRGGNAWETQVEIVKGELEFNKWIELEFDFSGASSRLDFDKIVVQFGAEGHTGPGIFYFDDFSFDK
jgi:FOG: PKD repeat